MIEKTKFFRPSVSPERHYLDLLSIKEQAAGRGARRRKRARATAATRCYRARLKAGEIIAPTVVTFANLELLIALGWLDINDSENRKRIGAAISLMPRNAAKHH